MSQEITHRDTVGKPRSSRRTEDHCATSEAHHAPTHPTNGSMQEPTLGLGLSLTSLCALKTVAVWFLWLLRDSGEERVGYVGLEEPGAEQNNAALGHAEPRNHPAPQPAPSVHAPCSRATATLTEPAAHLADSSGSHSGSNYQGRPSKLYCTLEASGLSNSDRSPVYCLVKMTHA